MASNIVFGITGLNDDEVDGDPLLVGEVDFGVNVVGGGSLHGEEIILVGEIGRTEADEMCCELGGCAKEQPFVGFKEFVGFGPGEVDGPCLYVGHLLHYKVIDSDFISSNSSDFHRNN